MKHTTNQTSRSVIQDPQNRKLFSSTMYVGVLCPVFDMHTLQGERQRLFRSTSLSALLIKK